MSFVQRLQSSAPHKIFYIAAEDEHARMAWYFLEVPPANETSFLADVKDSGGCLTDYGTIIKSGYGNSVPENVKHFIQQNYQCEPF